MPEPVTTPSYDANNRQLTFGDKTLAYDDNGNLQSITDSNGTTLYQWNARNQLVGISGPSVNASFVYDGMGRREAKTINGSLTEFLYDGLNPVQETSGATILANILPGLRPDEFLTRTDVVSGATGNFMVDVLGSPVAVTDSAGVVQTEYTYETFGRTAATGASNSSSYQYTGRENDGTGLYHVRARYYNPILQRFIQEDPIGFRGGDINVYAYVSNNPLNFIDPLGLSGTGGSPQGQPLQGPIPNLYPRGQGPSTLFQWAWETFVAPNLMRRLSEELARARLSLIGKFKCDTIVYFCHDLRPKFFTQNMWNVQVVTGYAGQDAVEPFYNRETTVCVPELIPGYDNKCCPPR